MGKLDELKLNISDKNPDVIMVTVTWCSGTVTDAFLSISDYDIVVRIDRSDTTGGRGGACCFMLKLN